MRKALTTVAAIIALACGFAPNAYADPLGLATPGIVGTADGVAGDNTGNDADDIAQAILNLGFADEVQDGERMLRSSTTTDYSGTIIGPGIEDDTANLVVPAGYTYALAKYDGKNAGWILFYLPTFGNTLPQTSYAIWGDNAGQYGLSNFTYFNPTTGVPDGGSTAALLGSILVALGVARRRFSKR